MNSYGIMKQCWYMEPEDRPTFKELCSSVSKCIERVEEEEEGEGEGEAGRRERGLTPVWRSKSSLHRYTPKELIMQYWVTPAVMIE